MQNDCSFHWACTVLGNPNSPADLSVAFPIGMLLRNARIIGSRLHSPRFIDATRDNGVLTGLCFPLAVPEFPGEFVFSASLDGSLLPRSIAGS